MPTPTFLLKLLSYFTDVEVESTSSSHNTELTVVLDSGRYKLQTANAVYSFEDKYNCFTEAFRMIGMEHRELEQVLVLGCGLGSIPLILEKIYRKNARYTTVDIDAKVLELAQKYLPGDVAERVKFTCADAAEFINTLDGSFDLICIDIFIDDKVPEVFDSPAFIDAVVARLKPSGIVLFNRMADSDGAYKRLCTYFEDVFGSRFSEARKLNAQLNQVLFGKKN